MEADFPFIKSPESLRNIDQHQIRYFSFDLKGFGRDLNADHDTEAVGIRNKWRLKKQLQIYEDAI